MALKFKSSLDDSDFQNKLRGMQAGAEAAAGRIGAGFARIGGLLGGGAILAGAAGLSEHFGRIKDQAAAVDLPIEEFQQLAFAFSQSGVSAETFQKGMANFTESLVKARDATTAQASAMKTLGLSLNTTNESDATEALANLADAYVGSSDKGAAFAAITDLVGAKVAVKMIPALVDGGAELRKLAGSASVASEEMVLLAESLGDKMDAARNDVQNRVSGGWYLIGKSIVDSFNKGADDAAGAGLPKSLQRLAGIGGAFLGGGKKILGIGEEGSDPELEKRLTALNKEKELKKEFALNDANKNQALTDDKAFTDAILKMDEKRVKAVEDLAKMHERIGKEEESYANMVAKSQADQISKEERISALKQQQVTIGMKSKMDSLNSDANEFGSVADKMEGERERGIERSKMSARERNQLKRQQRKDIQAEDKFDRQHPGALEDIRNARKAEANARKEAGRISAVIDAASMRELISALDKIVAK